MKLSIFGKSEKRINLPPNKPPLFQKITETEKFQNRSILLGKWKPRRMSVSEGVAKTGLPQIYQEGSPEQTLGEFIFSWKTKDFLRMAEILMPYTNEISFSKFTKEITNTFEEMKLIRFHFVSIEDEYPSQTRIKVSLEFFLDGKKQKQNVDVNLKFLNEEGNPSVFGVEVGEWTFDRIELHPINFY